MLDEELDSQHHLQSSNLNQVLVHLDLELHHHLEWLRYEQKLELKDLIAKIKINAQKKKA